MKDCFEIIKDHTEFAELFAEARGDNAKMREVASKALENLHGDLNKLKATLGKPVQPYKPVDRTVDIESKKAEYQNKIDELNKAQTVVIDEPNKSGEGKGKDVVVGKASNVGGDVGKTDEQLIQEIKDKQKQREIDKQNEPALPVTENTDSNRKGWNDAEYERKIDKLQKEKDDEAKRIKGDKTALSVKEQNELDESNQWHDEKIKEYKKERAERLQAKNKEKNNLQNNPEQKIEGINNDLSDFNLEYKGTDGKTGDIKTTIKDKDGNTIGFIHLNNNDGKVKVSLAEIFDSGKGIGTNLYKQLNKALVKSGLGELHSDTEFLKDTSTEQWTLDGKVLTKEEKKAITDDVDKLIELDHDGRLGKTKAVQPAVKLWEKLVKEGVAEKTKDGYKFKSLSKQESGGKAPVTKPEGKSDVVDKASKVGGDVGSKLEKPYKTVNDGSGKMVKVVVTTTEKNGVKTTKFKTQTTNKQGESREQNDKGFNTFEEAVENLGIDLKSEENESALELIQAVKESQGKENIPVRVTEIREGTDKSSPFYGKKVATLVVGGEKVDVILEQSLKEQPKAEANEKQATEIPNPKEEGSTTIPTDGESIPKTEERTYTKNALDRADAKKIYQQVREVDKPVDAAQVALEYIANGGKISEAAINEVAGRVKRASLNTGAREKRSTEYNARDYSSKTNETLDQLAHNLWELNDQKISEIEIKDALMDAIGSHNTRLEAGKAYLERYSPEYAEKQQQEKFYQEHIAEIEAEEKAINDYLNSEKEIEIEAFADENFVTKLIEKYEAESKGENQQSTSKTESSTNKGTGSTTGNEGNGKEPPKGEEPVGEGISGDEKVTGVKKSETSSVRAANGFPKIEFPKMGSDITELESAKNRVDSGEANPQDMVDRILNDKTGYRSEEEVFDMQYYAHQLERKNQELDVELSEAKTPEEKAAASQRKLQLSDVLDRQTEAAQLAGNKWGKIGNAMQPVITDSGQIFRQAKDDIKVAYGGEIPPDVQVKIDAITKERDDAIAQRNKVEQILRQKMAAAGFEKIKKDAANKSKKTEEKEALNKEASDLIQKIKDEFKGNPNDIKRNGLPITDKMVALIGKLAINYVKQGINGFEALVDKLYEGLKDQIDGISRSDIKNHMANYDPLIMEREINRLNKQADILNDKITPPSVKTKGNKFTPSEPTDFGQASKLARTFRNNTDWVKANQRVANAEFKIKIEKRKALESQKNLYQKTLMWAGRLTRLSILSGYNVLGKLAAAATVGSAAKRPVEQIIGGVYSKIFSGIAKKAPIEGQFYWMNAKAEARYYREFFHYRWFKSIKEILSSGTTSLGKKLGSAEYEHVPVLYLPTDLHQIIKDPPKRATFESSFLNGMIHAEKNGLDINDPLVINSIENAAYKRAQYEIFQEENIISKKFTSYKSSLEKKGNVGATGKFIADFMIPVSTVPTNIVRRIITTSPLGLIRGGVRVTEAYRKGIEKLTPEQADHVMRQLKQGSLGTALWLIGWFGVSSFGGLYSKFNPAKKRDEGDLKNDEMSINGEMVPKPVQHALPLEIIQFAATARRIYDNYVDKKGATNPEAIYQAGMGSIGALVEQIPVIETGAHVVGAFNNPYEAKKLKDDIKRRLEPQILRETGVISKGEKQSILPAGY